MSVRDWWRIKRQKKNQCSSWLAREKLTSRATRKRPYVKHMTRSWRVMPNCQIHKYFARKVISRDTCKILYLTKRKNVLPYSLPTLYIFHYPWNVRSVFQWENLNKNTWELEIVIPTIIYTFSLSFPLLLPLHTSPSLHP